jgi:hypothetical protein
MASGFAPLNGGFGGFGASFPTRINAPQSQTVENPIAGMSHKGWEGDWQNRYNAEEARRGQGASAATPGRTVGVGWDEAGYLASNEDVSNPNNWNEGVRDTVFSPGFQSPGAFHFSTFGQNENRAGSNFDADAYLRHNPDVAAAVERGEFTDAAHHFGIHGRSEGRTVNERYIPGNAGSPGYTPDFTALNAERDKFEPIFQNNTRRQQAFDNMAGLAAPNALLPEGYTGAGFGQVSGDVSPGAMALGQGRAMVDGAVDGVSNDFLTGVYDPRMQQATGVYRPPGSRGGMGGLGGMF